MKMMDRYHILSKLGEDTRDVAGIILTHESCKGLRAKRMKIIHTLVDHGWQVKMAEFSFTHLLIWRDNKTATKVSFEDLD